jgi:hypothetical protein
MRPDQLRMWGASKTLTIEAAALTRMPQRAFAARPHRRVTPSCRQIPRPQPSLSLEPLESAEHLV